MESLKLSNYFQIIKPQYIYIRVIPHKSIRNYNSDNIVKAISYTYKTINKRIRAEQRKLFFETSFKISYIIDIHKDNTSFYFLVPEYFKNIIIEKINEIWSKATVEEVEKIEEFSDHAIRYEVSYKKEDALSLYLDKKSNEPLNSILSVLDIMKDDDRVTILYNFMPCSQLGWEDRYNSTMIKVKDRKPIEKRVFSFEYIVKSTFSLVVSILEGILQVLSDFTGGNENKDKENLYTSLMNMVEQKKELSAATKRKKELNVVNTQIAIVSDSADITRRNNNGTSVCQAYRILDGDNELVYKNTKSKFNIEDYDYKLATSTFSCEEAQNFLQVPGDTLLKQYKMRCINVEETKLPEELRKGYLELGIVNFKGTKEKAYIEDNYDKGSLPLVIVGAQGAGKSTFGANYYRFANLRDEGGVVIDFIKNCELSDEIISYLPKDKVIVLDLTKESDIQGFAFNELSFSKDMDAFKRSELANLQSQQIVELVDAVNPTQPLQSRMRRYLSAAATLVFSTGENSIKEVIRCLESHKSRMKYLDSLNEKEREYLHEEIEDMEDLNEYSKVTKDNPVSEIIGTKESKIEGILDRISLLRSDFKLKYMFNKDGSNNINFVEELEKGKVIIIKMKQDSFKKHSKNVITTFFLSKIWIATEIRGSLHKKPKPTHIFIDEVFQTETAMKMLANDDILPQTRKFGCKFIFSCQYTEQINILMDTLIGAGASFMFLTGTSEKDFNFFKSKLGNYEFEDLKNMEQYSSLNSIYYSGGYASFISKLPGPLKFKS